MKGNKFAWKDRASAVKTAVYYHAKGFDVDYSLEIALGIDSGMYYGMYCKNVVRITSTELERFHHDVVREIEQRYLENKPAAIAV